MTRRLLVAGTVAALLGGCAAPALPTCASGQSGAAWIVDHGWHTEIALRAEDAGPPLAYYRAIFPQARYFLFGFGKLSWVLDEGGPVIEVLRAPLPGAGVVKVTALTATPAEAYTDPVLEVGLPPGGPARIAAGIAGTIARGPGGEPKLATPAQIDGSFFYVASRTYTMDDNCNTWVARQLHRAGVALRPGSVLLPSDLTEALTSTGDVCRATGS